ncbi:MAG: hypothetical protein OXS29_03340 [bacterium]|nr:hypothetical protein [bacterium]MDE0287888.1 hypothetical protein [bacterium]MDE0438635.1 hypothetical protein [bacterium]
MSRNTPSKKGRAAKWKGVIPAAFLALLALVIWQLVVVAAEVPAYIVPSPTEIGRELIAEGPSLVADLGWTMLEAVAGFLIGGGIAFVTAVVFVHVRIVERAALPSSSRPSPSSRSHLSSPSGSDTPSSPKWSSPPSSASSPSSSTRPVASDP